MAGALLAVGSGRVSVDEVTEKLQIGKQEAPGQGGKFRWDTLWKCGRVAVGSVEARGDVSVAGCQWMRWQRSCECVSDAVGLGRS